MLYVYNPFSLVVVVDGCGGGGPDAHVSTLTVAAALHGESRAAITRPYLLI